MANAQTIEMAASLQNNCGNIMPEVHAHYILLIAVKFWKNLKIIVGGAGIDCVYGWTDAGQSVYSTPPNIIFSHLGNLMVMQFVQAQIEISGRSFLDGNSACTPSHLQKLFEVCDF